MYYASFPRRQWKGNTQVSPRDSVQEERGLTPLAFSRLLQWLDDGVDSQGETYLAMRRRLVAYFERRNRLSADELADETLTRVSKTLEKTGAIAVTPPARYCYVVARFVLLEDLRRDHRHVPLDEERHQGRSPADLPSSPGVDEQLALQEQRYECFERCLQELRPEQRELVIEYYRDSLRQKIDRRRELAASLGITANALAIRACRIRATLEACVETCRTRR